jgi:hypothetical protein
VEHLPQRHGRRRLYAHRGKHDHRPHPHDAQR